MQPSTEKPFQLSLPQHLKLHTRKLLTSYVNHNKATGLWIATINTNQNPQETNKSNGHKYLKAFSFQTEHEARETAYVNAPPMMIPFDTHPSCFMCESKFSLFRRAAHCRNCGVCICSSCCVTWKKAMIPETYNHKNTSRVKVCMTCDYLSTLFRFSLVNGDMEQMQKIYMTGNINLRCPFLNVKSGNEIMLPIHCAVEGGNMRILSWLVDVHHCPIKMINTGNRKGQMSEHLISTSNGRTVLDIAMAGQKVQILHYLINQKGLKFNDSQKKEQASLAALEAVLRAFPSPAGKPEKLTAGQTKSEHNLYTIKDAYSDDESCADGDEPILEDEDFDDEQSVMTTIDDPCVVCCNQTIDCVLTPCGHQICCLECGMKMNKCPICAESCVCIRIFRP